ncbi:hypothetical protein PS1_024758 [Malus domestica]
MPVVCLHNGLFNTLSKYASSFQQKVVTPDAVHCFARECKSVSTLGQYHKLVMLEYCLEDLLDADVGTHAYNLPLLPLANGEFGSLSDTSKGISYFVCNNLEYMLLQHSYDRVIVKNIPINILNRLSAIAKSSKANLVIFKCSASFSFIQDLYLLIRNTKAKYYEAHNVVINTPL